MLSFLFKKNRLKEAKVQRNKGFFAGWRDVPIVEAHSSASHVRERNSNIYA